MRYGAVIIARGRIRKDRILQAESLIKRLRRSGVSEIVLVDDCHLPILKKTVEQTDTIYVPSTSGMKAGLKELVIAGSLRISVQCSRVFVCILGQPACTEEALHKLSSRKADVVCPKNGGKGGYPLLLGRSVLDWLMIYNGKRGLHGACRALVQACGATMDTAECSDTLYPKVYRGSQLHHKAVINWI